MAVLDLSKKIGMQAMWNTKSGLRFEIVIKDVRERFGLIDYLIEPIAGDGQKWVEENSVNFQIPYRAG